MKRRFSFFVRSENAAPDRDFLQLLEQALLQALRQELGGEER